MAPFERFAASNDLVKRLEKYGKQVAPLELIGTFLSFVGNTMLFDILQTYSKKIFYPRHKAKKVKQIIRNGEVIWSTEVVKNEQQTVTFLSKNVIMATGASQILNRQRKNSVTSDYFLKQEGYEKIANYLRSIDGPKNVCVLGSSHSGFSVVNVLVNGPCQMERTYNLHYHQQDNCFKCKSCSMGLTHHSL